MSNGEPAHDPQPAIGTKEFAALAAFMMALFAMSIDLMLPALDEIGADLSAGGGNTVQLVVTVMIAGMALGQLLYGPVSDARGRKPAIYAGLTIFTFGCVVAIAAPNLLVLLTGRFLQGLGVAGPRVVTIALVRDQFEGAPMARLMSGVTALMMIGPLVAPLVGAGILRVADWRATFAALIVVGLLALSWFALRQRETLPAGDRGPLTFRASMRAAIEVATTRSTLGYSVASGLALGMLFGWVSTAPQIFAEVYDLDAQFPFIFAPMGLAVAAGSLANVRLVTRFPIATVCEGAVLLMVAVSTVVLAISLDGNAPPVAVTLAYVALMLASLGAQFGSLNTLAMAPLGHIAGSAAGIVGSIGWLIAAGLGTVIGQSFDGTLRPLIAGFAILAAMSFVTMRWARRSPRRAQA
jgi:DHA1 family bicyclomycin/chloramphenicol resistance-like MFS transporter